MPLQGKRFLPRCPYCNADLSLYSNIVPFWCTVSRKCPFCDKTIHGVRNLYGISWGTSSTAKLFTIVIVGFILIMAIFLLILTKIDGMW